MLLALAFPGALVAGKGSGGAKSVHVRGYTKKDGTYVAPHERSAPDNSKANNWSTKGSANPYTGQPGTKDGKQEAARKTEEDQKLLERQIHRAKSGSADSQYELGIRHLKGEGVKRDEAIGRAWLSKAAKQGHTPAYVALKNTDYAVEKRDAKGRIIRSSSARREFMKQTGYPNGRPGYVVDHIIPLKRGGCDCPENMQWQTIEAAKAKDKWE